MTFFISPPDGWLAARLQLPDRPPSAAFGRPSLGRRAAGRPPSDGRGPTHPFRFTASVGPVRTYVGTYVLRNYVQRKFASRARARFFVPPSPSPSPARGGGHPPAWWVVAASSLASTVRKSSGRSAMDRKRAGTHAACTYVGMCVTVLVVFVIMSDGGKIKFVRQLLILGLLVVGRYLRRYRTKQQQHLARFLVAAAPAGPAPARPPTIIIIDRSWCRSTTHTARHPARLPCCVLDG